LLQTKILPTIIPQVLDIGEWSVYVYMTAGQRAVNGLVQSVAVRSSGFYTTTLSTEAPALHISYLFMMVFGVYPFAMAIRSVTFLKLSRFHMN
jgi:Trk-type K+ transport system membrane component